MLPSGRKDISTRPYLRAKQTLSIRFKMSFSNSLSNDQAIDDPQSVSAPPQDFQIWLEAGRTERHYWYDLWRYRELFTILAWRDVALRYKQTVIGAAWGLIQPFLTMVVMTIVFGKVAGLDSTGSTPYAILVFAGMLPWQLFSNALSNSSQSLVGNANLISKIYFPRIIVPLSSLVVACVDFSISFVILGIMMIWFQFSPNWRMLALPGLMFLALLTSLGPGLIIAALNVKFRDFRFVLPFILQIGLYICPVGFSGEVIRQKFGDTAFLLYSLNPMVGVIDGFRWAILGSTSNIYLPGFCVSVLLSICFLIVGIWYFRKTERTFADII
jgi:lipopolysaccharide transport system permease protein